MSTNESAPDPLLLLRQTIANKSLPIPTTSADPSSQAQTNVSLAQASFLLFNSDSATDGPQHTAISLTQPTRFQSAAGDGKALDLRSVFLCWLHKDSSVQEYINATTQLNGELQQTGKNEVVTSLVFLERLDLNTWLTGEVGEHESEYIKGANNNAEARRDADDAAQLAQGGQDVEMRDADVADSVKRREEEQRLRDIYAAERKMGDHNTVLRGIKIQDFSGMRKYSALFLGKVKPGVPQPGQAPTPALNANPALRPTIKPSNPNRRVEPIILLSSSFSSLLRMPNIKSFLNDGVYAPLEQSAESPSILHITRQLRTINPGQSTRFILVDDPSHFRPDYWSRVVAVFTTGQTWQFKGYKWTNPAELFSHALGVYVGWKGEVIPDTVKGWGRQVLSVQIDKGSNRWRDREVVEDIWSQIEGRMRMMGMGR
ncbi:related to DNA-directed RNA polymerase II accessory protein [Ramularia collo-cygni]|uniref:Related to DNA-directed RNA polymerase II accessory protein n=1 Tax=Ramularia collo-cygni TaxID=112498 RepID=A0A2D3V7F0_9PEZI|nr:related to DNA-directed RNA polymerase II accessory protein [Ramularia collo-cygni]CZT19496.1 related to DNA-directed RNA polymerase II accessory protein [Ramularia collo-cygni]